MNHWRKTVIALLLFGHLSGGWSFPWDKDMVDQPSAKAQESEAPGDSGGTPVNGGETVPAPTTERGMFDAKDAAVTLPNPIAATPESLARGKYFYEINCKVCHGESGRGDGPVGKKFTDPSPVDLNDEYTQDQADGQLFFTLTRGRVAMPFYRDALSPEERWDVVNYVKNEFGEANMASNE
jgi:mono/diheme cytochrome c family protein